MEKSVTDSGLLDRSSEVLQMFWKYRGINIYLLKFRTPM